MHCCFNRFIISRKKLRLCSVQLAGHCLSALLVEWSETAGSSTFCLQTVKSVLLTANEANMTLTACQRDVYCEMPLILILFCVMCCHLVLFLLFIFTSPDLFICSGFFCHFLSFLLHDFGVESQTHWNWPASTSESMLVSLIHFPQTSPGDLGVGLFSGCFPGMTMSLVPLPPSCTTHALAVPFYVSDHFPPPGCSPAVTAVLTPYFLSRPFPPPTGLALPYSRYTS